MKVLPRHINFSETAPASVEEMKDGEMRATPDGVYARVGNQVLSMLYSRILPVVFDCGVTGGLHELNENTKDPSWELDGEEGEVWTLVGNTLTKLGNSGQKFIYSILEGGDQRNYRNFVLPKIHMKLNLVQTGSAAENLRSIQDNLKGPGNDPIRIYIDDGTKEIWIVSHELDLVYAWVEGSGWTFPGESTGVAWTFNEWWTFEMERSGSQWRISIKDELDAQVILTDWREWKNLEFESNTGTSRAYGGNAGLIVLGLETSGPGGCPQGQYKDVAFCTGLRRFLYTNFVWATTPKDVDRVFDVTTSGAGGTVNIPDTNYNLEFALLADGGGPPSEIAVTQNFANTGISSLDEFDMWSKLHMESGMGANDEQRLQMLLTAYNSGGAHEAGMRIRYASPSYRFEYRAKDGSFTDDWTELFTGSYDIWVRMRWMPSLGDTRVRMYYSLVDPTVTAGWTEIFPATASPDMSSLVQEDGADFEMSAYNDEIAAHTHWIEFISDARHATFLTTTTTTTTTTT